MFIKNWFSNMLPLDKPFEYPVGDGTFLQFKTVENFYVAMKTEKTDVKTRRLIANLEPHKAKSFGRKVVLRKDWDAVKLDVMRYALKIKFAPGTTWHKELMATTDEIVEWNNWNDTFWGAIATLSNGEATPVTPRRGKNMLGVLLMDIRDSYRP